MRAMCLHLADGTIIKNVCKINGIDSISTGNKITIEGQQFEQKYLGPSDKLRCVIFDKEEDIFIDRKDFVFITLMKYEE